MLLCFILCSIPPPLSTVLSLDGRSSITTSICQSGLLFLNVIPWTVRPIFGALRWEYAHLNPQQCFSSWIRAAVCHSVLYTPPFSTLPVVWAFLCDNRHSSIPVGTSQPRLALFFYLLHPSNTFCVLHFSTQHSPSSTHLYLATAPLFHIYISDCLANRHFDLQLANIALYLWLKSQIEPNNIGIQFHPIARFN